MIFKEWHYKATMCSENGLDAHLQHESREGGGYPGWELVSCTPTNQGLYQLVWKCMKFRSQTD